MPRRFAGGVSPVTVVDVILTQTFARELAACLAASPDAPIFGAVVGQVFEDPACARRWIRVDQTVSCPKAIAEDAPVETLAETIEALRAGVDHGNVLGWFRSHHQAGLYLSPDEARFHEEVFREPWEFALVMAGAGERLAGGVFQRTDPEGLSRSVYTPFYELVDDADSYGSTGRPTLITWANYQTDARIVRAADPKPPTAVSTRPELTPAAKDEEVARPARRTRLNPQADGLPLLDRSGTASAPRGSQETPSPLRGQGSTPEETAAEKKAAEDHEAEWEKIQIQRSLTAVGRSLGPGTIGQLGAPAPDERDTSGEAPSDQEPAANAPEEPRSHLTVVNGGQTPPRYRRGMPADGVVIPIDSAKSSRGLVGGSRRRRRLPIGRIAAAAAGVILMAGAGWAGARSLGGSGSSGDAAQAGLSVGPDALFGENGGSQTAPPAESGATDPLDTAIDETGAATGENRSTDGSATRGSAQGTGTTGDVSGDPRRGPGGLSGGEAEPSASAVDVPTISAPERPQVDGSTLEDPLITDTSVTPYQNAISIFRTEITRYDATSRRFDDGDATCNPLNLAFRGLIDASRRLEARYAEAEATLDDAAHGVYRDAQRRFSVARTHYELTDCPMPVGG